MFKNIKKGAADLIAIVVSVVVIGGLAIGVTSFISSNMKTASTNGIDQVFSNTEKAFNKHTSNGTTECTHENLSGVSVNEYRCTDCGATVVLGGGSAEPV